MGKHFLFQPLLLELEAAAQQARFVLDILYLQRTFEQDGAVPLVRKRLEDALAEIAGARQHIIDSMFNQSKKD